MPGSDLPTFEGPGDHPNTTRDDHHPNAPAATERLVLDTAFSKDRTVATPITGFGDTVLSDVRRGPLRVVSP